MTNERLIGNAFGRLNRAAKRIRHARSYAEVASVHERFNTDAVLLRNALASGTNAQRNRLARLMSQVETNVDRLVCAESARQTPPRGGFVVSGGRN